MARTTHTWAGMSDIVVKVEGNGIARLQYAIAQLESTPRRQMALRRALNHTGDKTYTIVRRRLSEWMGLTQKSLEERGLRRRRANNGLLEYTIIGKGKHIPLKEFAAKQGARGVSAAPWAQRKMFKHTFIVDSIGGNVFKRISSKRLPIEKLWGPAIPREMVKGYVAVAFQKSVATNLVPRVEHEVRVLTQGIVS